MLVKEPFEVLDGKFGSVRDAVMASVWECVFRCVLHVTTLSFSCEMTLDDEKETTYDCGVSLLHYGIGQRLAG